ncbi:hypothetical protein [Actimicrobium sp. CCI2.3]|uniref:hypothetical protein n=1 Tax=Actimicrobium sp. CCI2.3 TaxID=3048616 RepID=UPI002B24B695|nr:hypothetical protein [Actimicrobium sp. CCI2.3]MEB0024121.1 hypothetical protein [Actimicrobium sp. CCI2.3]
MNTMLSFYLWIAPKWRKIAANRLKVLVGKTATKMKAGKMLEGTIWSRQRIIPFKQWKAIYV